VPTSNHKTVKISMEPSLDMEFCAIAHPIFMGKKCWMLVIMMMVRPIILYIIFY